MSGGVDPELTTPRRMAVNVAAMAVFSVTWIGLQMLGLFAFFPAMVACVATVLIGDWLYSKRR